MDLEVSMADAAFRDEVRTWLREHVPKEPRPVAGPEMRAFDVAWQRTMHDAGYAGLTWPKEYGGAGRSLSELMTWYEEYALARGPYLGVCFVGVSHAGPTILNKGSAEQRARYIPKILRGEETWCQGFSEPDAGSDLASLRTRAVLDGDEWVVTGQKTWTSFAQHADQQELLVRTDPDSQRHQGLTWLVCDMHAPGLTVRPVETMAHVYDVAEVFYDEVRIPVANVVGQVGHGWDVAMSTLAFERGSAFLGEQIELATTVDDLVDLARRMPAMDGRRAIDDEHLAHRLATARADVFALRALTLTSASRLARDGVPGPHGSMLRLFHSELKQRIYHLAMDVLGPSVLELEWTPGIDWVRRYLSSYSATIGAGTAEIQRTVIAERVLGLPRRRS